MGCIHKETKSRTEVNVEKMSISKLPKDLWTVIGQKLNTTIDVTRFRGTCCLWRSSLSHPSPNLCIPHHFFSLLQTKIYSIQPSSHDHNPSTSSSCSNKGWLIKVFQDPNSSKLYLLDLFTNERLTIEETMEKYLNLMNFRVVELFELYTLCRKVEIDFSFEPNSYVCKVILFSVEDRCMVFELCSDKTLKVSNIGKKKRTVLKDDGAENEYFDDIILYKGQVYVVDKMGTVFWINALSLKLFQFSPKNVCCGESKMHVSMNCDINKKQLVECDGSLYVIDLYVNDKKYYNGYFSKDVFVEVFKLDQEWGKWLDVKDLGDVSFVLGKDSNFALLAKEYYGCEGNCIYFASQFRTFCFSLESLVSKPPNMFWPCLRLFHPKNE